MYALGCVILWVVQNSRYDPSRKDGLQLDVT